MDHARRVFAILSYCVAAAILWVVAETLTTLLMGEQGRARLTAGDVLLLVGALGVGIAILWGILRTLFGVVSRGRKVSPAVVSWWTASVAVAGLFVLRMYTECINKMEPGKGWLTLVALLLALAIGAALPVLISARLKLRRSRLLEWLTLLLVALGAVVMKLEFHFALYRDAAPTRLIELGVLALALVATVLLFWLAGRGRQLATPSTWGPTRWLSMALVSLALVQLTEFGCDRRALQARAPGPPQSGSSVLLIVVDTLRADGLGCYGADQDLTPNLDRLAAEGIRFETTYSAAPWTLPSMATMLTGLLPGEHGAGTNPGLANNCASLPEAVPTLATICRSRGITSAALVTNPFLRSVFGLGRDFTLFRCTLGMRRSLLPLELLPPLLGFKLPQYTRAEHMTDMAKRWLAAHQDSQFFLMLHYMDPHLPYLSPPVRSGRSVACAVVPDPSGYAGEIRYVDEQIGRLVDWLRAEGRYDELTIVVTADHGECLGEHGLCDWEGSFWARPFEHGHTLYDELLQVPLIVKPCGSATPGLVAGDFAATHLDLAPTILSALGLDAGLLDPNAESLLARVQGYGGIGGFEESAAPAAPTRAADGQRLLMAESMLYGPEAKAVFDARYKLIMRRDDAGAWFSEAYDRLLDPREKHNIWDPEDARFVRLQSHLAAQIAERPADNALAQAGLSTGLRAELSSLGYLD